MIAVVLLTPIIALGLVLLLEHIEEWAFDRDERITVARRRAAGASPAPTRSATVARNMP